MNEDRVVEVRDLRVDFPLESEAVVHAVRGVSFHIDRGETLALVGESGSGKSVTAMTLLRLTENAGGVIAGGSMRLRRRDSSEVEIAEQPLEVMQDIRGADISMIFQEPMTSLNPVLTIGFQISEAVIRHQNKSPEEAERIALEVMRQVRVP